MVRSLTYGPMSGPNIGCLLVKIPSSKINYKKANRNCTGPSIRCLFAAKRSQAS